MIPPTGVVREIKAIYTHVIITSILKENSEKIEISRLVLSHVNIILKVCKLDPSFFTKMELKYF